ncbi:hypothetical protein MLD38_023450 [Melastoma candidum]|uniref:Uncharacterized protein n=1 Tax=Melastoma candidum TaxID=119954 RepID=A0ACB9NQD7_9MYRT|nr:hypothetical protein MLD38_023450 [Melastoma candidum]
MVVSYPVSRIPLATSSSSGVLLESGGEGQRGFPFFSSPNPNPNPNPTQLFIFSTSSFSTTHSLVDIGCLQLQSGVECGSSPVDSILLLPNNTKEHKGPLLSFTCELGVSSLGRLIGGFARWFS